MNVFEIIFSPTGGTKKAADIVAGKMAEILSCEKIALDLTDREYDFFSCSFTKEDVCVIAVPAYGGRVPHPAAARLKKMQGTGAKTVLMTVYGNREFDDTLVELSDITSERGFVPVAGIGALAEHSIVRQYAAGRPDKADEEKLSEFAVMICEKLKEERKYLNLPGNRPYKEYKGVPLKPKAGKTCVSCGACAKACPVGAIPIENPGKTDAEKCISCMRCLMICPKQARSVDKLKVMATSHMLKKICSERKENKLFL